MYYTRERMRQLLATGKSDINVEDTFTNALQVISQRHSNLSLHRKWKLIQYRMLDLTDNDRGLGIQICHRHCMPNKFSNQIGLKTLIADIILLYGYLHRFLSHWSCAIDHSVKLETSQLQMAVFWILCVRCLALDSVW
jgi:hypothetical protein